VFGRRKREQENAAREAERRALFEELAKRPETICPFLGMAGSRTDYQESVSDEHRCYAFGDPAELSAEQQQKVCLQPGYGNCPRYLRGVLVIPTEELEALRHPAPLPPYPAPAAAAAAGRPEKKRRAWGGIIVTAVLVLLIVGVAGGGAYWYLRNQVPPSLVTGTLPTGTDLSAELISLSAPNDGSQRLVAAAAIGEPAEVPQTTIVYVIDLSWTTLTGLGCGGDRNRDGLSDTTLDCEIAAATSLNTQAIENGAVSEVGVVGFAGGATTADLADDAGTQVLAAPDADDDGDGTPNVVEALESAYSGGRRSPVGFRMFTPVETNTVTTTFSAGVVAACEVMSQTENENRLVVFLSDGRNRSGEPVSSVLPCEATAVFQTFAVGAEARCEQATDLGGLQEMAELTEGLCTTVIDLALLPEILQAVVLPQIVRIQLTVDGGDPIDISLGADPRLPEASEPGGGEAAVEIAYPILALESGEHRLCMTVFASDAGGAGEVESCSTVDAGGGRLTSN
jgi:hypothetical protein